MNIELLEEGKAAITLQVSMNRDAYDWPESHSRSLIQFARALVEHTSVWNQRFAGLAAEREVESSERLGGELVEYTRSIEVPQEEIPRFFNDSALTILTTSGPGWRELSILPGESRRASRDVKRYVERTLDDWSRAVAEYANATADLYRYLDEQPHRAEALLGQVFIEQLSDEDRTRIGAISEEEEPYVGRVRRAMQGAIDRADVSPRDAGVIAAAARLVYDPFPAQLTITVPLEVLEVEGFRERTERVYEVPRSSIWEVLLSFENRWSEPELLTTLVDATQEPPKPIDLAALAARNRRSRGALTASDVRRELENALRPAAGYRIRWAE